MITNTGLQIAYIAGFFDGEGCISGDVKQGLRVVIDNTDLQVLQHIGSILQELGISCAISEKKTFKPQHSRSFRLWFSTYANRKRFLELVQDHLIVKKFQCRLALAWIYSRKGRRTTITEQQKNWIRAIKWLNQGGLK